MPIQFFNFSTTLLVMSVALFHKHFQNIEPCAWCVLQRLYFVSILLCSILGFKKGLKNASVYATVVVSLIGIGTAIYQIFWANSSESCNLSIAEKFMNFTQLNQIIPSVFESYALCSESNISLIGLPYAAWSLITFLFLFALNVIYLVKYFKK